MKSIHLDNTCLQCNEPARFSILGKHPPTCEAIVTLVDSNSINSKSRMVMSRCAAHIDGNDVKGLRNTHAVGRAEGPVVCQTWVKRSATLVHVDKRFGSDNFGLTEPCDGLQRPRWDTHATRLIAEKQPYDRSIANEWKRFVKKLAHRYIPVWSETTDGACSAQASNKCCCMQFARRGITKNNYA